MDSSVDARRDFRPKVDRQDVDQRLTELEALNLAATIDSNAGTDKTRQSEDLTPRTISTKDRISYSQAWLWIALFGVTIFLGAFLLFQVQPILGKFILPWFGGSPGVWTTCMLFFQCMLFGGYAYAHILSTKFRLTYQVLVHVSLIFVAVCMLPITPSNAWKPTGNESPIQSIVLLLVASVGIPYFLLSSTGPLLQSWLAQSKIIEKPYRLYSLSNIGSMLALLSFPFLFETMFSSREQSGIWSCAFLVYAVLCIIGACGIWTLAKSHSNQMRDCVATDLSSSAQATSNDDSVESSKPLSAPKISWDQRLRWLAFSCLPSMMLLATTNQVCLDTAVIPFLWIVPLAIYLLSFILTFESERWYNRRLCVQLGILSYLSVLLVHRSMNSPPLLVDIIGNFSGLFFTCMVCHGELYAARPQPKFLTNFYLTMSFGGALGGLLVGLVAPNIFPGFYEYQISIFSAFVLFFGTYLGLNPFWRDQVEVRTKWVLGLGLPALMTIGYFGTGFSSQNVHVLRNFYGVLSVMQGKDKQQERDMKKLVHGRIVHGSQYLDEDRRLLPTTYYSESSGVGKAIRAMQNQNIRVGVVGLGIGTLATYGKEGDYYKFYEINPDVISLAKEQFTFLKDTRAQTDVVLGDARLVLEREEPQEFDLFVLDAFSGDAIPVHLLTQEAMEIYRKHLKPDGKIAIHVSNLYFDLKPIVQGLADDQRLVCQFQTGEDMAGPDAYASIWALLANDQNWLDQFAKDKDDSSVAKPVLWRDDRSNLFQALK